MKPAAFLLLLSLLFAPACREAESGPAAGGAAPIIRDLAGGSASLPLDARLAVGSYMDAERLRIELEKARAPARIANLKGRLETAENQRQRRSGRYREAMDRLWEAIRSAEDPNLDGKDRQELSPYLPAAKATAERVAAAYEHARRTADLYLDALRMAEPAQARRHHAAYLEALEKISRAGR